MTTSLFAVSASLKLKLAHPSQHPTGVWYEDDALVAAGGLLGGVLDMHQLQYYPANADSPDASPFLNSVWRLSEIHGYDIAKPTIVGEFPAQPPPSAKKLT